MKKITYKLTLRFALSVLACLFLCVGGAWAQEPNGPHIVTLNSNSGSFDPGVPETITISEGQAFGHLPVPKRNNFTFAGWYSIPGDPTTRIDPTTKYSYATHHEMLHARWANRQQTIDLVFIGLDGKTEVGRITIAKNGGALPDIPAEKFKLDVADNKYFAGYYTRINGEGERIYSGVPSHDTYLDKDELRPVIDRENPFTQTTYLYAFQTHVKHTTHWDYTYANGKDANGNATWININPDDQTTRIQYGKLTFMDNSGEPLKWIYFKAANVANKETELTGDLDTHTTTKGMFHLQLADGTHSATTSGETIEGPNKEGDDTGIWNVYFTDDDLSRFTRYNFEPFVENATTHVLEPANHWLRTTDPKLHDTWFTFTGAGAGNSADLPWTVTLENLKVYPDNIIVKPLFWDGSKWAEISQLVKLDGVTCQKDAQKGTGPGSSATYSGSYPVWKDGSTQHYGYAVGMVGFEINGTKVYLNKTNPGSFDTNFNSANSQVDGDTKQSEWNAVNEIFPRITYTIQAMTIPVVRFLPGRLPDAKLDGNTPSILWGTEGETISDFDKYFATCPEFKFLGWSEEDGATTATYTTSFTFNGAKTLYPVWQDDEAPVIKPEKEVVCKQRVNVHVKDNVKVENVTISLRITDPTGTVTEFADVKDNSNYVVSMTHPQDQRVEIILERPVLTVEGAPIETWVFTINANDGTLDATPKTVTIYSNHLWGETHYKKDPTATEPGYTKDLRICEHCGETDCDGKIIPTGSVLVKREDGTTTRWSDEVNRAIEQIDDAENTGHIVFLTTDSRVEHHALIPPTTDKSTEQVYINLNGKSFVVDDGPDHIYGNQRVTILLIDDGDLEYTNRVEVTITPILYKRNFNTDTRARNWQALYLPIAVSESELPDGCTLGKVSGVSTTTGAVNIGVTENVTNIEAKQPYFVKSDDAKVTIDLANSTLYPYSTPEVVDIDVTHYFRGSLTNSDNVATVNKAYWVLTNGGSFTWSKADNSQRPYHWVIYDKNNQSAKPNYTLSLYTVGEDSNDATGINSVEANDGNNAIYTIDGMKVDAKAKLAPGIYVKNGKKVVINK